MSDTLSKIPHAVETLEMLAREAELNGPETVLLPAIVPVVATAMGYDLPRCLLAVRRIPALRDEIARVARKVAASESGVDYVAGFVKDQQART